MHTLLSFLLPIAQVTTETTDLTPVQVSPAAALTSMVFGIGFALLFSALMFWKVFTKAGYPGWASLVPIYNAYVLCKVGGKPGWWVLLMLIPFLNLIFFILLCIGIAENFGKGGGFAAGLILLGIFFFPILGFGSAQYRGPAGPALPGGAGMPV